MSVSTPLITKLMDAIVAMQDWHTAMEKVQTSPYKGDARKAADAAKAAMDAKWKEIDPVITRYRNKKDEED